MVGLVSYINWFSEHYQKQTNKNKLIIWSSITSIVSKLGRRLVVGVVASALKPDGKGIRETCLDKMTYVQDSDILKQMQYKSETMLECGIVWAVNKENQS